MPQQTSTFESHFLTHMQGVAGAYHKLIACIWVPILQVGGLGKVWVNCFPKAITTWLGWESNPRPPDPESDALTTLPRFPLIVVLVRYWESFAVCPVAHKTLYQVKKALVTEVPEIGTSFTTVPIEWTTTMTTTDRRRVSSSSSNSIIIILTTSVDLVTRSHLITDPGGFREPCKHSVFVEFGVSSRLARNFCRITGPQKCENFEYERVTRGEQQQ